MVLVALLLLAAGCGADRTYTRIDGSTMGTYYQVTAFCPGQSAEPLTRAIEAVLFAVNAEMSTYDPSSELSQFNASAPGNWFPVSAPLLEVVGAGARLGELTGGAFDVTVAPLVDLWGFGPSGATDAPPSAEAIARALEQTGWEALEMQAEPAALRKTAPLTVDLSAIAKGHGVDRVAAALTSLGCMDLLVDIGGEVLGQGQGPRGGPWRVGVEVPDPTSAGAVQRVLSIDGRAVATSGDYRNFIDYGDSEAGRVSHTIDPRTGRPVTHNVASVTVVHESTMLADGLATALNVLGLEEGLALAESQGLAALFVVRLNSPTETGASAFEERYTSAMQNYLEPPR
ncbi:MAG: FAD:protein FMN transferase [Pseudomonadota bacterium]